MFVGSHTGWRRGEGRSRSGADMRDVRNRKGGVRDVPQTRVTRTSQATATCRGAVRAAPAMRGRACAAHPVCTVPPGSRTLLVVTAAVVTRVVCARSMLDLAFRIEVRQFASEQAEHTSDTPCAARPKPAARPRTCSRLVVDRGAPRPHLVQHTSAAKEESRLSILSQTTAGTSWGCVISISDLALALD